MEIKKNVLSPEEYHRLFTSVGWEAPSIEQIKAALEHSLCTFSVCDGERVIGMARLLGDSAMTFYIKDLAVEKGYQGRGAGKLLMESIYRKPTAGRVESRCGVDERKRKRRIL